MTRGVSGRPLAALLALAVVTGTAAAQAPDSHPLPGGIADAAGKVGYVHAVKGGAEAIDLATGKVLWAFNEPARPLALSGKLLLCQGAESGKANAIRVLVLDAESGKLVRKSDPVVFPDWVSVAVTYGRSFTSSSSLDGNGQLLVRWEARAFYAGGAPPPPEVEKAARKHAAGLAKVNIESGKVEMLPAAGKKAEAPKLPAGLPQPAQLWTGTEWLEGPQVIGDTAYAVFRKQAVGAEKLELASWPVGAKTAEEAKTLMAGQALWPQLGLDRKHLFVHQAIPPEQLQPKERVWTAFALPSGKQVGTVPYAAGGQGLTLIGPRAYYTVGEQRFGGPGGMGKSTRTLRAVDVATGKTLWEHGLWAPPLLPPLP